MTQFEKLGLFYLGRHEVDEPGAAGPPLLLYDSKDLLTHAVCVGMTGSGKTGLCVGLIEEAALDGIPSIVIDPKGDLANLLLTFPELRAQDFRPWINEEEARREELDPDKYAAQQATLWRDGLADWGQDGQRIGRLRQAADFAIYTPGSEAGLPVSILASFSPPPPEVRADGDLFRERIGSTATGLLSLLGVDADPLRSREHILLSTLLETLWTEGKATQVADLVRAVQSPPMEQVGAFELEAFFPSKDRLELALQLNNLLAAPTFRSWLVGEPLDLSRLLYTESGAPRVAVFSIAHLSEAERMFFVTLLLNQTLSWIRTRSGTSSLRALLYMDEIFGYLPPVAEPPSKKPLLTLLKQARAYGLGVVLATQNPVDLDYKGLSNIGTWFIGRLQTERDKARMMDGLKGVASRGGQLDSEALDTALSGLEKRVFLMHNVHDDAPALFRTRWVMSYLRGPLTRQQIRQLMDGRKAAAAPSPAPQPVPAGLEPSAGAAAARPAAPTPDVTSEAVLPQVDGEVLQLYLSTPGGDRVRPRYRPHLLGLARVHYFNRRTKELLATEELKLLLPLTAEMLDVDWNLADPVDLDEEQLGRQPAAGASWERLPAAAKKARSYKTWERELAALLYRDRRLELFKSPSLRVVSEPGEDIRDYRIRLAELAREERDQRVEELRLSYDTKREKLEERLQRAEHRLSEEKDQAKQEKLQTAISLGATVLSVLTGRKRLSQSTLGRATTAFRGAGRSSRQAQDVERAEESLEALQGKLEELAAELQREIEAVEQSIDPLREEFEVLTYRPRKSDIEIRLVALAWAPEGT
jgi:hypothetical protein